MDVTILAGAVVVAAFLVSVTGTGAMRRLAPRWGLMDVPEARKVHRRATPLGGGLAIYAAVIVAVGAGYLAAIVWRSAPPAWLPPLVVEHLEGAVASGPRLALIGLAATGVMLLGLLDDCREVHFGVRLAVQVGLAAVVVAGGIRLTGFLADPVLTSLLTVVWIVGLTNAFNFLDNMDALSAGVAVIASFMLLAVQVLLGHWFVAGLLLALVGALGGFLVHNWPPARIFMGDAGSNFVGFLLGTATVLATFYQEGVHTYGLLAPLCVMAVPIYDSASVILLRLRAGLSPFRPDKRHFSHRLVELGLSSTGAVLTIYLVTVASGLGALLLYYVDLAGAVIIVAQVVAVLAVIAILESAPRRGKQDETAAPENAVHEG